MGRRVGSGLVEFWWSDEKWNGMLVFERTAHGMYLLLRGGRHMECACYGGEHFGTETNASVQNNHSIFQFGK